MEGNCNKAMEDMPNNSAPHLSAVNFAAVNGLQPIGPTYLLSSPTLLNRILGHTRSELASVVPPVRISDNCAANPVTVTFGTVAGSLIQQDRQILQLGPLPPGVSDPRVYVQYGTLDWRVEPDQRAASSTIDLSPQRNGFYQVFARVQDVKLAFRDVYTYPNPTTGKTRLHVEIVQADKITFRLYDASGELVLQKALEGAPTVVDGQPCYEEDLDLSKLKPGVYIGIVVAERAGRSTERRQIRIFKSEN